MTDDHTSDTQTADDDLRIRRVAQRANYERDTVNEIIDAALVAHVGTVRKGAPVVIPMLAVRDGDWLLLHGAHAAGPIRRGRGQQVCVEMTLLDGLVLARSAFHHSLNYRSVVVLGEAEVIVDEAERERALEVFMERLVPGRQAQLRPTTTAELKQTAVMRISLERASTKVRMGPPGDEEEDYAWPVWAGVLPIANAIGQPEADPRLQASIEVPQNVRDLAGTTR
jgi:nitroimidazol reductase NimA-like FMN-containing flavoprotein (pyridoxamine 5'-phosphate oxidase superfamily)